MHTQNLLHRDTSTTLSELVCSTDCDSRFGCFSMLEIGNGQLSAEEGRTQLALWCIMKAPLLSGTDLSRATPSTLSTLAAADVIAVNQDPLGVQGTLLLQTSTWEVWAGELVCNCTAVVVVNIADHAPIATTVKWADIGIPVSAQMDVVDLWTSESKGRFQGGFNVTVQTPHDNAMFKICPSSSCNNVP